jgi:hypothetical protein
MGDCCNMYGRRPDGKLCDRTVRHCRPDGRMFAASNFHFKHSHVRTKGDGRPDG